VSSGLGWSGLEVGGLDLETARPLTAAELIPGLPRGESERLHDQGARACPANRSCNYEQRAARAMAGSGWWRPCPAGEWGGPPEGDPQAALAQVHTEQAA
jgi:hypothetical protein